MAATGWDDDDNNWWMKLAAYTYLADGKVGQIDFGNGVRTGYGYDERGMIQIVDHYRPRLQDISWRQYYRDNRDRITAFQKGYNPGANPMEDGRGDRFRYDEEGQLVEAWYNASNPVNSGAGNTRYDGFGYDALGNRTQNNYVASRGLTSFIRRDNGLNQYSSWSPSVVYHDDNSPWSGYNSFPGNGVTMAEGWLVASYNALNQPVAMVPFGWSDAVFFGYDPLGRCVKRWVGSSGDVYSNPATYFHYDGWNLLQEGNNAWGPSRVYVHGNRVDEIVWSYNTFTGDQAFHQHDARGHCTLLTDSSGNALEQYEYDAFGQPYFFDATGNSIGAYDAQGRWAGYSLFGNRFLFTGREWLSDLKVYDYRNRMYQPELGRFLQPDPKEFAAGDYNLYRYCHNDPVNRSDPFGLEVYGTDTPFKEVSFVNSEKGEYGHTEFVLQPRIVMDSVGGGFSLRMPRVDIHILARQVSNRVKVKGEMAARHRSEKAITATKEHEKLHEEQAKAFDKDNQNRVFPGIYSKEGAKEALRNADAQVRREFKESQNHNGPKWDEIRSREAFR